MPIHICFQLILFKPIGKDSSAATLLGVDIKTASFQLILFKPIGKVILEELDKAGVSQGVSN